MIINYADRSALPVVFPALRQDLGLSDVEFGLLGSLFLWSYALCGPLAGVMADRFSRTKVILLSLVGWSAVTLLTGAANGFIALAVLRIGLGISESFYLPAAAAVMAANHGPATRGRAMGLLPIAASIGVILGATAVGFAADHYGWRNGFYGLGIAGIALALGFGHCLRENPVAVISTVATKPGARQALAYLLRVPTYLILLAGTICAGIAVWIFFNWLSLYLVERYGIKMSEAGFAGVAMLQLSSMLGIVVGAWLSDHVVRRDFRNRLLVFAGGYFAAAPFLLCFLFKPSFLVVSVCCASFSFLRALGSVNEMPVLCEVVPPPFHSTAVGILIACATTAGGAGIFVGGLLKRGPGLEAVFAGLGGFFAFAATIFLIAYRKFITRDVERANAWSAAAPA